jgi:cytochrome c oxidase subunit 2
MRFRAFTVSEADFERWAAHQKSGPMVGAPPAPPAPATGAPAAAGTAPAAAAQTAAAPAQPAPAAGVSEPGLTLALFPRLPDYAVPKTPIPPGIDFPAGLVGDAQRGRQAFMTSACVGCHAIQGLTTSPIGPNLTHVGSRTTIAAGLYPNDAEHLARWIKNAPVMKPGSKMPPMGQGLRDPVTNAAGMLDDAKIADIVAFLLALK